ncbi:unnamed protein product [Protopolystoma xenopodis]|uniref:Uncharacterized protein n=1 Tax=Protopolystoma xenopodis TaxID=117903 RepID=A0A448WV52_9PLAT|nr:unnamed protein product [Protopolystoma xenopodis]
MWRSGADSLCPLGHNVRGTTKNTFHTSASSSFQHLTGNLVAHSKTFHRHGSRPLVQVQLRTNASSPLDEDLFRVDMTEPEFYSSCDSALRSKFCPKTHNRPILFTTAGQPERC